MPDIFISGAEGRIEAKHHQQDDPTAPVALFLHPHPLYGGTMNNKVVYNLYHTYVKKGFNCLRFNFRGVGRSQGSFAMGEGELTDSAAIMDWLLENHKQARQRWIVGFSFGAWVGMQLLMRRPEVSAFVSVAPPANMYDFNFLAPCPIKGLVVQGTGDTVVPHEDVLQLYEKIKQQRGIEADLHIIDDADHFFTKHMSSLCGRIEDYIDERAQDEISQNVIIRNDDEDDDYELLDDDDESQDDDLPEFEEIEEGIA